MMFLLTSCLHINSLSDWILNSSKYEATVSLPTESLPPSTGSEPDHRSVDKFAWNFFFFFKISFCTHDIYLNHLVEKGIPGEVRK